MALKLKADPTFWAAVEVPLPGGGTEKVEFQFKHRTVDELVEWEKGMGGKKNRDAVLECVVGWKLSDDFTPENVDLLLNNYHGAARAISRTYLRELVALRLGN